MKRNFHALRETEFARVCKAVKEERHAEVTGYREQRRTTFSGCAPLKAFLLCPDLNQ
jgi:hypothetical protein